MSGERLNLDSGQGNHEQISLDFAKTYYIKQMYNWGGHLFNNITIPKPAGCINTPKARMSNIAAADWLPLQVSSTQVSPSSTPSRI